MINPKTPLPRSLQKFQNKYAISFFIPIIVISKMTCGAKPNLRPNETKVLLKLN